METRSYREFYELVTLRNFYFSLRIKVEKGP